MDTQARVAIVGVGGVFSGAPTPAQFWANILAARDTSRDAPAGRWLLDRDDVYDPGIGTPDRVYSMRGYFLDEIPRDFSGLDVDPELVEQLDPLFHLVLAAGQQAWRDARTDSLDRQRVGVIFGNLVLPTEKSSGLTQDILGAAARKQITGEAAQPGLATHALNSRTAGLPASLLARLGLGAGSYTLDAACASSLYALKLAADKLLAHETDAMLAGGACRPDTLYTQMGFSQLRALSPSGCCRPLDARGDGLVVGEGAGFFVLKRLDDALRAGDQIYAVIAGIGLSNDIKGNLLAPDSEGQLRALRSAYAQAGWRPHDVDLIECHATGTPVGDAVELDSLHRLWGPTGHRPGQCVLGSVKANIGHTLTAAGAAGVLKLVLAMRNKILPATANFERPRPGALPEDSPFRVLRQPVAWESRGGRPRRAAINGFGFGGTNAHVLLEEWTSAESPMGRVVIREGEAPAEPVLPARREPRPPELRPEHEPTPIAIVGMDARFGPRNGLQECQERMLGKSTEGSAPPLDAERCWGVAAPDLRGWLVDEIEIPLDEFRIAPRDLEEMLPQQQLMLLVAARALADARLGTIDRLRMGVFVGLTLDLNTTNFHFRWSMLPQARQWNQELGLGLTPEELDDWTKKLKEAAGPALTPGRVLGALGSITASRIARAFGVGGPSFTVSSEETSGLSALDIAVRLLRQGELDYALVGAVDFPGDIRAALANAQLHEAAPSPPAPLPQGERGENPPVGEGAAAVMLRRLDDAERDGNRIYAVVRGLGAASEKGGGPWAMTRAYADAALAPQVADIHAGVSAAADENLGTPIAAIGDAGAAAGLAALMFAALALEQRRLPPLETGGRVAQYWLHDRIHGPRRVALAQPAIDGSVQAAILEEVVVWDAEAPAEPERQARREPRPPKLERLGGRAETLFAVEADDIAGLLEGLARLRSEAQAFGDAPLTWLGGRWIEQNPLQPGQPLACALVARDVAELSALIQLQEETLRQVPSRHPDPALADRSFSTHGDVARGQMAFVFPGAGNHFAGMGRDLSAQWPEIFRRQERENERLRSQFAPEIFWDLPTLDDVRDHRRLIQGQVALGTAVSDLLGSFGVHPDAALGYSLGETTALFALRVWRDRDEMLDRLFRSPLFAEELAGQCTAARRAWGLAAGTEVDWVAGVVAASPDAVRNALRDKRRAYLLLINTPAECVVGGQRRDVEDVVAALGCAFFPLSGVSTVHCEIVREVEGAYRALHRLPVTAPRNVRLYGSAQGKSYQPETESCAEAVTAQALTTVDFARLIRTAHEDGVRHFIEIGPGSSCTRMIGKILAGQPHLARSACVPGPSGPSTILRLLAQLIACRVPVDLRPLYGHANMDDHSQVQIGKNVLTIVPGHPPLQLPMARGEGRGMRDEGGGARGEEDPRGDTRAAMEPTPAARTAPPARSSIIEGLVAAQEAGAAAHAIFLRFTQRATDMLGGFPLSSPLPALAPRPSSLAPPPSPLAPRELCLDLAIGSVARVFGPEFAEVDSFPTRVRLPDEPLMLVDRILAIEGEPRSLGSGRIVTEHDVFAGDWYLDNERMPAGISIESGQADLALSGYLGIDFQTRGLAVYRLLDASVTFHRALPAPGEIARYDIHIDHFFRQGDTYLFRFRFEGTVNGEPLLTMTDGCAGFFSEAELAGGKGIVRGENAPRPKPTMTEPWTHLVPVHASTYDESQLDMLRAGDLAGCFGERFTHLTMQRPLTLPGAAPEDERLCLIDRVVHLDPRGGAYGMGVIRAEQDIHPDDWFLTCHFVDDQVMPGTLMYECCLHTLRFYLLRLGWIAEADAAHFEPKPGVTARLKCRGQVIASTRVVSYEITIKEWGKEPHPYAIGDALMFADGRAIVEITGISLQLGGVAYSDLAKNWQAQELVAGPEQILAFAVGKPSEAFGERYRIFDEGRRLARLPGPPYAFLDRVLTTTAEPWQMVAGGTLEAEYDIPEDAWYFASNRQPHMPFAVLQEVALQPCGWLAAYVGSALTSPEDLRFRNLGGKAVQRAIVTPASGTLATFVRFTKVASSGGMIIQDFDFSVRAGGQTVLEGSTTFGFFTDAMMARQVGLRAAGPFQPKADERAHGSKFTYPPAPPFPDRQMRMIDRIDLYLPDGGRHGLGAILGSFDVDPDAWFFAAHFFQDPVCPGSLGLEALVQLMKVFAVRRFGGPARVFETNRIDHEFRWLYRGQVIPTNKRVEVQAVISACDESERSLVADGWLSVDGLLIYQMNDFSLRIVE